MKSQSHACTETIMFYPRTQYDWINNAGHMYKNTTHQNITMHYLECIFLNCLAVMTPILPLTFRCLSKFRFPFKWWWKTDLWMSSCIIHLCFYLINKKINKKNPVGILINCRLDCNNSHMFLHVHNHQTWTQIITLPTVSHKTNKSAN